MPVPSQMRGWNQSGSNTGPSMFMDETPRRPIHAHNNDHSKLAQPHKSPEKIKKSNALPGFHNAFMTSTPLRSSQQRQNKGKLRDIGGISTHETPFPSTFHLAASPPSSPAQHLQRLDIKPRNVNRQEETALALESQRVADGDVEMAVDDDEGVIFDEESGEEIDAIEPFNWKIEVPISLQFCVLESTN
jgi:hypothetical protein